MIRSVAAVLLGVIVAIFVITGVEALDHLIYPPPPGLDPDDPESIKAAMARAPVGALLGVLIGWGLGSFAGGWVSGRMSRRAPVAHALIAGALLLISGIANLVMIPHPTWFRVLGVLVFLPSAWAGGCLAARRPPRR